MAVKSTSYREGKYRVGVRVGQLSAASVILLLSQHSKIILGREGHGSNTCNKNGRAIPQLLANRGYIHVPLRYLSGLVLNEQ